jgi:hypothetical protein
MLKSLGGWKTTLAGVGTLCTAAGHLLTRLAAGDTSSIPTDVPFIITGLGLIFGMDAPPASK